MLTRCPHCSHEINVPDDYLGKRGKCPKCSKAFVITDSNVGDVSSVIKKTPKVSLASPLYTKLFILIILIVAILLAFYAGSQKSLKEYKQKETELQQKYKRKETELQQKLKDADAFVLLQEEKMHKIYPDLVPFKPGKNLVNRKYLNSFTVSKHEKEGRRKITVNMSNKSNTDIHPDFKIYFLDKYGFSVGESTMLWVFSTIKFGETRTDSTSAPSKAIERAKYYIINFDEKEAGE